MNNADDVIFKRTPDEDAHGTACVILAAGNSRRFGSAKMLYPLLNDRPMILTTIEIYKQVFEQVNVVVKAEEDEIRLIAESAGANVVRAVKAEFGMSQSLISGIQSCSDASRWLIALGDMPYVLPTTLSQMLEHDRPIVAPRYRGRIGNPVIFSAKFKTQLLSLLGDKGGRSILQKNLDSIGFVDVDDIGVVHDVDIRDDILTR